MPIMKLDSILSRDSAQGEPVRQNTFEVIIEKIEDLCPLNVVSFPMANWSVAPVEKHHMNVRTKFAGKPNYDTFDLIVHDTIDPDAATRVYEWYTQVFDPDTGAMGLTSDYKCGGTVTQFDVTGAEVRTWTLYGVWPTTVNFGEGNYEVEGDPVQITLTLSVDYITL